MVAASLTASVGTPSSLYRAIAASLSDICVSQITAAASEVEGRWASSQLCAWHLQQNQALSGYSLIVAQVP